MSGRVENCAVNIIDIGASGGIHPRFKKTINNLRAILFEPDPREFSRLKQSVPNDFLVLNTALAEIPGEVVFHLCKKQEVSSIYLPNEAFLINFPDIDRFSITKSVNMITDSLDNQLEQNDRTDIDFIKIDTEGSELSILKGAQKNLRRVMGLEIEVCFAPIRKNQPLFHEIHRFVTEQGFQLLDLKRYYWQRRNISRNYGKGQIIFGDTLYFRSPESICQLSGLDDRKIIAGLLLFLVYGYLDQAKALYIQAKENRTITSDICKEIGELLEKYERRIIIPDFKGKQKIYNILNGIANIFCANTWARGDRKLGN